MKLKKTLMNLSASIVIFSASSATGNIPENSPTCDEVLTACNDAFEAKKRELQLCDLGLLQTLDQLDVTKRDLRDEIESNNKIWKNPYLLIGLGVITGVIISK